MTPGNTRGVVLNPKEELDCQTTPSWQNLKVMPEGRWIKIWKYSLPVPEGEPLPSLNGMGTDPLVSTLKDGHWMWVFRAKRSK